MRSCSKADCAGEPPGELIDSATALSPGSLNAVSNGLAKAARLSAGRNGPGACAASTPWRRSTATVGSRRRHGRLTTIFIGQDRGEGKGKQSQARQAGKKGKRTYSTQ